MDCDEINSKTTNCSNNIEIFLPKYLSDTGKYAYGSICFTILNKLYLNDYPDFVLATSDFILNHLELSDEMATYIRENWEVKQEINVFEIFLKILFGEKYLECRMDRIIQDLIYLALTNGEYDARWRVLIKNIASKIGVLEKLETFEELVADLIIRYNKVSSSEESELLRKKNKLRRIKRGAMVLTATAVGGAVIGLTGGMAAPVIVESLSLLVGSTTIASALAGSTGTVFFASLFGTAGASLVGYKMSKRVGDLQEFRFGQLSEGGVEKENDIPFVKKPALTSTIAISGWINDLKEDCFSLPWKRLYLSKEQYYLCYESSHLLQVGKVIKASAISSFSAILNTFSFTSVSTIVKGITWPAVLMSLSSIVDLPWSVGCNKACLAGKQMAEILLTKQYGHRPVTLIGYSLGARVIFYCLLEMSERSEPYGIIEDVYLIGAPCPASVKQWQQLIKVVSGTITNAYSQHDNLLKFLYRTLSLPDGGAAGIQPINLDHSRLRNVDLSSVISGHSEYNDKLDRIFSLLNIRTKSENIYPVATGQPSFSFG